MNKLSISQSNFNFNIKSNKSSNKTRPKNNLNA